MNRPFTSKLHNPPVIVKRAYDNLMDDCFGHRRGD